ncbi:hypothetical protein [Runella sp.]|uniref:hypothetical protein n=1 Tax=Runella sp. TaxID=1960881 RepID=UPI0026289FCD|nr:hypothetical protein [Runella sp.]
MSDQIYNLKKKWIFAILLVIGSIGIGVSTADFIDQNLRHHIRDISVTLSTIGLISLLYELNLRTEFNQKMEESIKKIIDEKINSSSPDLKEYLQTTVTNIAKTQIRENAPNNFTRLKDSGIFDCYGQLKIDDIGKRIATLRKTEIRISKIWIPSLEVLEDILIKAIDEHECIVKIVLLDPDLAKRTLEKRAQTIEDYTPNRIESLIRENRKVIESIYNRLDNKSALKFHEHDSFVSVSLVGYSDTWIMGTYLNKRIATKGTQVKVRGCHTPFYIELDNHFTDLFENQSKPYLFSTP